MTEAFALALLASVPKLSYARRARLLEAAGSAENVLADPGAYMRLLGEEALSALHVQIRGMDEMRWTLEREGVTLVARGDAGYPPLLLQTALPPHVLFVQGEANLADACPFSIVGTRQASEYGLRQTRDIARELAKAGVCVVSGLAVGVDAAAHKGALDAGGRTVAVLGSALDRFYPAENAPLRRRILESGGSVVSEFPMGQRPTRYSFLQRNRIIAGMSLGLLVTEGPMHSGALHTAQDALDEGREVFALPGRVDSPLSALPNRLIAEGARLTVCARDILNALVIEPGAGNVPKGTALDKPASDETAPNGTASGEAARGDGAQEGGEDIPPELGEQERAVLRALADGDMDFDALCEATAIAPDDLGALLTLMELDGYVTPLAGLRYARARDGRIVQK